MSDEFAVISDNGKIYTLRIWGVNQQKGTTHCMSLLLEDEEIETFHLDDIHTIKEAYLLKILIVPPLEVEFTKRNLILSSKQLQAEGKGVIKPGTSKLMDMIRRRKHGR